MVYVARVVCVCVEPATSSSPLARSRQSANSSIFIDDEDFDEEMEDFDSVKLFIPVEVSRSHLWKVSV